MVLALLPSKAAKHSLLILIRFSLMLIVQNIIRAFWRHGALHLRALAILLLAFFFSPAEASSIASATLALKGLSNGNSTRADFNADGVLDQAFVSQDSDKPILNIALSGVLRPHRVPLDDRIIRLVASDIDHDGDVDLVALTAAPRLLVWLNDRRGRFSRAKSTVNTIFQRVSPSQGWPDFEIPSFWPVSSRFSEALHELSTLNCRYHPRLHFIRSTSKNSPRAPPQTSEPSAADTAARQGHPEGYQGAALA